MQAQSQDDKRSIVPRWRSLADTSSAELKSVVPSRTLEGTSGTRIARLLAKWLLSKKTIDAVEVLDAATVSGDKNSAVPAALDLVRPDANVTLAIGKSALRYLNRLPANSPSRPELNGLRANLETQNQIRSLKARLSDAPRDAVSAAELSRIYTLIGQRNPAERWMSRALKQEPDNRYILRSASALYAHLHDPQQALDALWRSDIVKSDPWVQAAEVAIADLTGKTPRWGTRARKRLSEGPSQVCDSELIIGLASLEYSAGVGRKQIRKMLDNGLAKPTENSLAQALWVGNRAGIEVNARAHLGGLSHLGEVQTRQAYAEESYEVAVLSAQKWAEDQPYSANSYLLGASCSTIFLQNYHVAAQFCRAGLVANPGHPMLANGMIVALTYLNRTNDVGKYLKILEAGHDKADVTPFVFAAKGLLAFRAGNADIGRQNYELAFRAAVDARKINVALNALIFWVEQEASAYVISDEEMSTVSQYIQRSASKLPAYLGNDVARIWQARKRVIAAKREHPKFDNLIGGGWRPSGPLALIGQLVS